MRSTVTNATKSATTKGFDFKAFSEKVKKIRPKDKGSFQSREEAMWQSVEARIEAEWQSSMTENSDKANEMITKVRSEKMVGNNHTLESVKLMNPELGKALESMDCQTVLNAMKDSQLRANKSAFDRSMKLRRAEADPMSAEAQEIFMENARDNYHDDQNRIKKQMLMSERTDMLYIPLHIKNVITDEYEYIDTFVDTGCQMTVINMELCRKLGCEKMIDTRLNSVAIGVGVQKTHGVIHMLPAKIGSQEFFFTCNVMDAGIPILLGLDLMKQHGAVIDLGKMSLKIMNEEISFLTNEQMVENGLVKKVEGDANESPLPERAPITASTAAEDAQSIQAAQINHVMDATGVLRESAIEHLEQCEWDEVLAVVLIKSME
eukprot:GHVH01003605.1.p1 GENE.GHVH01003605.1~~GHVH01003605.1.p1  ORF type:complete len:377 (+),score=80.28 GHVH01003605.1:340-1470(+)